MLRAISLPASFAVLLALLIGSVLFSSPERATASDDTVTTVLQPGLNLAGWTGSAASIDAIFDEVPELDLAYAWDAENQWFVWAVPTDSGVLGICEDSCLAWAFFSGWAAKTSSGGPGP